MTQVTLTGAAEKKVRRTVDLSPDHHRKLNRLLDEAADRLGRGRVTSQEMLQNVIAKLLDDEDLQDEVIAMLAQPTHRIDGTAAAPHCHSVPVVDSAVGDYRLRARAALGGATPTSVIDWVTLWWWQDGRCAVCGDSDIYFVRDHCHKSLLVRGLLCQGCNSLEGVISPSQDRWHEFDAYRARPPAMILNLRLPYRDALSLDHVRSLAETVRRLTSATG
jgi:hypothetical protein